MRLFVVIAALVGFSFALPACMCQKMKEKLVEKAVEEAVEKGMENELGGGEANVDISKGKITVTNDKGETVKLAAGGGVKMPDNWPDDVPSPPGGKVTFSMNTPRGTMVTFQTEESSSKVMAFYADTMKSDGWKTKLKTESEQGGMLMLTKKPKRQVQVVVAKSGAKTTVNITAALKK